MIVAESNYKEVIQTLKRATQLGLDSETTGLRPFHGNELFSIAIAADVDGERVSYYFNFWPYNGEVPERFILPKARVLKELQWELFMGEDKLWFLHNAKFDLHMLERENCRLWGQVHCTKAIGRVCYNEYQSYSLEDSLERIGEEKDPAVEAYIDEHELYEMVNLPHRAQREKRKFYYLVPFTIMAPYAEKDACGTLDLGYNQLEQIASLDAQMPEGKPTVSNIYYNECRLTKTIKRMEMNGCRVDPAYCEEASAFESVAASTSQAEIEEAAGLPFKNSEKFFLQLFKGHEHEFTLGEPSEKTGKRSYLFNKDTLPKITHPAVEAVLRYRAAKSRLGFYQGFLYHRDADDIVHPSFNPDVARHGRFSSSNPNFQNLKKDDVEEDGEANEVDFFVRRAVIPREGNVLLMPDYSAFEYRMAMEYTCRVKGRIVPLAQMILDGMDFHDATIELVKKKSGIILPRRMAKVANFLTLYSGGPKAMSEQIKIPYDEACEVFDAIRSACPELQTALKIMEETAYKRGFIYNWYGRHCHFPNKKFAYKAGNYIISGGCADANKIALNEIQDEFDRRRLDDCLLISTVHDENPADVPKPKAYEVACIMVGKMEAAFPYEYVPMKVDMAWSARSLADKVKGFPS